MKNDYEPSNEKSNNEGNQDAESGPLTDSTRRAFVRKSLAAGIIAAQPSILSGLIRADGGGGETTTNNWGTTQAPEQTTQPQYTTYPYTTQQQTTYATTSAPNQVLYKEVITIIGVGFSEESPAVYDDDKKAYAAGKAAVDKLLADGANANPATVVKSNQEYIDPTGMVTTFYWVDDSTPPKLMYVVTPVKIGNKWKYVVYMQGNSAPVTYYYLKPAGT